MNHQGISYYLDANALLKFSSLMEYQEEQGVENVRALVETALTPVLVSDLAFLEVVAKITKFARQSRFNKKTKLKVIDNVLSHLVTHIKQGEKLKSIPVVSDRYTVAFEILRKHSLRDFGAFDALHIAIVKGLGTEVCVVSSDKGVKNICELENIQIYDPELNQFCTPGDLTAE